MKGLISVALATLSLASANATSAGSHDDAMFKAAKESQPQVGTWRRVIDHNPGPGFQQVRPGELVAAC